MAPVKKTEKTGASAEYEPSRRHRWCMRAVLWFFLCSFAVVVWRLVGIHLNPEWNMAEQDITHVGQIVIPMPRGDIVDRNGRLLATDKQLPLLWADPVQIPAEERAPAAARLGALLGLDPGQVAQRLDPSHEDSKVKRFSLIKRKLTDQEVESLGDLTTIASAGLFLDYEHDRFYPEGDLAAHLLGYVNREREGMMGIEQTFDPILKSTPERRKAWKDGRRVLLTSLTLDYQPPTGGDTLQLTLDADIQNDLEKELDRALVACHASRAMGILMDPHTGAILALAVRPAFDPNNLTEADELIRTNRAVSEVFEPGSTFKIVTAAAAIEENLITPDSKVDCEGGVFYPYGRRRITDTHKLGVVPFRAAFAESSNIAMIKLAATLGSDHLDAWIRRFGFGDRTSRDFLTESRGIYRNRAEWSNASIVSLPMGQEIAVTMPQIGRAFCAIANGGYLVEPHVVIGAKNAEGITTFTYEEKPRRQILHAETAQTMRELCHEVVTSGTGRYANIDQFRVGGKTGTAQIADLEKGGYLEDRYTTVFAGFAPLDHPRICGVIVVQEPMIKLHYGGYVCGPVFRKVVEPALIKMNTPPDPVQVEVAMHKSWDSDPDTVMARMDMEGWELSVGELLAPLDGLELVPFGGDIPEGTPILPDLRGLTKRQARDRIRALGIHWAARGSGWVAYQDPPAGTPLYGVSLCRLVFSNNRNEITHAPEPAEAPPQTG